MDKREFNIKVEQIKKRVNEGDYGTAMRIADAIDWRRVRNINLLTMVAQIYERNGEYGEAKNILLLAFERAPSRRTISTRRRTTTESSATWRPRIPGSTFCGT